jgi:ubiquinone/menaquinone biosynthesis C-methylase UbiE
VADVGAGTGLFVPMLARAVGPRGEVLAVDIVPDFLAHIDERATAAGLTNVSTVLCTERSVELARESVDLAFLCDVYHHFEYPADTLASLHRALQPGGTLAVIEFDRVEGESSDWILEHVRAGKDVFTAEIEAAGFELLEEVDLGMEDTYYLRFRKVRLDESD